MRILLLGGYQPLVRALKMGLEDEGFTVDVAHDGPEGDARLATAEYDAIVLDLVRSLPAGAAVLRRWRDLGLTTPVLVLTGVGGPAGVDVAADDWLAKPFALKEFVNRLRALGQGAVFSRPARRIGTAIRD